MAARTHFLVASVALAIAAGCYTGTAVDDNESPESPTVATNGTDPAKPTDGGAATVNALTGLPCDVAVLLKNTCDECHGAIPKDDAPNTIVTYADLVAKSESKPSETVAQLALARMKSTSRPMPPDAPATPDEVAILANWIAAGMPKGACGTKTSPPAATDAGDSTTPDPGASDAGTAPPPPVAICTSGVTADPTVEGPTMRPGNACVTCHATQDGPDFTIGGTVFPTLDELDDCNGVDGTSNGTEVLIIDATGAVTTLPVNEAGNFYGGDDSIQLPYRALVVRGNSIREMRSPQKNGDCNSCHTELGTGAPGRVMSP